MHQEMPQQSPQQHPAQQLPVVPPQQGQQTPVQMPQQQIPMQQSQSMPVVPQQQYPVQPPQQPQIPLHRPVPPQGQQFVYYSPPPPSGPQENPGQALSTVSLVLGIISILLICITLFTLGISLLLGIPLAILGLICGIAGKKKTPQGMPNGVAVAGITLSTIGIVSAIVGIILMFVLVGSLDFSSVILAPDLSDFLEQRQYY